MRDRIALWLILLPLLALEVACIGTRPVLRRTNSALDFLYPDGFAAERPGSEVVLRLPLRVGLGFAPHRHHQPDPMTEQEKQTLLSEVAAAFEAHEGIGHLEVVPSAYLQPGGSFRNLDQLNAWLGLDLMVLVSYDQAQFTDATRASWTYLTIIGPLLIQGEKNDTRTVMDAVVYDIRSRALLFRAAGASRVKGASSPVNIDRKRRRFASAGFEQATDQLIVNLNTALLRFEEQAAAGTVHGPGTPGVAMYDAQGERVTPRRSGGSGGGAFGGAELIAVALLCLALLLGARCRAVQ